MSWFSRIWKVKRQSFLVAYHYNGGMGRTFITCNACKLSQKVIEDIEKHLREKGYDNIGIYNIIPLETFWKAPK